MDSKKGQLAIFVIIAIAIVGILFFLLFYRSGGILPAQETFSPQGFLRTCIGEEIKSEIEILSRQGGYYQPEGYVEYFGDKIKYLCYTSENYKTCVIQQPLLKENVELQLNNKVKGQIEECAQSLKSEYEKRGYDVQMGKVETDVNIDPNKIKVELSTPLSLTKQGESRNFDGFDIEINSEIYFLLMTATSIVDFEATYGDSEITTFMQYYPDLKIEKIRLGEGSKVYRLTNIPTNETFSFASRSLVWPAGYGL